MHYEITFLGRKKTDGAEALPESHTVLSDGADEPEAIRKLLDTYDLVWISSITEFTKH